MDAYDVHKKIQEAIMSVQIYKLKSPSPTSLWHKEIIDGLDELAKERQTLSTTSKTAAPIKLRDV